MPKKERLLYQDTYIFILSQSRTHVKSLVREITGNHYKDTQVLDL